MGLRENILSDPISTLELRELLAIEPDQTVRSAVELMREKKLGCVVVIDQNGRPLGKFTEHHLLKLLVSNPKGLDCLIKDEMTAVWAQVNLTDPISKALDAMQEKGLRFVVVIDEQGKAVGLTGQKGMMEYIADHFPRQVKVQMMESKLYMDQREGA